MGKHVVITGLDRVFYPAIAASVEKRGLEKTPNLEINNNDSPIDAWNWWTQQARDLTNFSFQPTLAMGVAWLLSKGLLATGVFTQMGRGGIGALAENSAARTTLDWIQGMNMQAAGNPMMGYFDPQLITRLADIVNLNPTEGENLLTNIHELMVSCLLYTSPRPRD